MEAVASVVSFASRALFLVLAATTLFMWFRTRRPAAAWVAATFGALAVGAIMAETASSSSPVAYRFTIALVFTFPYLLFRFADALEPFSTRIRVVVAVAALGAVGWTLALPALPEPGSAETGPGAYIAYVLVYWTGVSVTVAVELWRTGTGQSTIGRRRLRVLSVATLMLSLSLIASGSGSSTDSAAIIVPELFGLAAAGLFLLGFATPAFVRTAWRQPEEARFQDAAAGLMTARTRTQVTDVLLPALTSMLGARGAVIVTEGDGLLAAHGDVPMGRAYHDLEDDNSAEEEFASDEAAVEAAFDYAMSRGRILVWASRYSPFFAAEEELLLRRLGLLAEMALDRVELLERDREARARLEDANAELEAFVYSASHDLKNPLIAMLGYLDVLAKDYAEVLDDDGRWYLRRMTANGVFMESLIQDLLELSRVGRVDVETDWVDLGQVVADVGIELERRSPAATLVVDDLPTVMINVTRARQLFANLIDNAAKYAGRDDVTIAVSSRVDDDGAVIDIRDDGVGIPEDYLERVFGVFERLQSGTDQEGTGIGLAICRKIVDSMEGRIWAIPDSIGAHIRIALPPQSLLTRDPTLLEALS